MERFYKGQCEILEHIAEGRSLAESLMEIVCLIEGMSSMACSILLLDPDGTHVRHGAAPSLPAEYVRMLDGAPIGPEAGSCGAAAFHRQTVIVEDIATHPNWRDYRDAALPHGLRACWSSPIVGPQGQVLGTFAMYYRERRGPSQEEVTLVETATHLAAVAIGHARRHAAEMALRASEELRARIYASVLEPIFCVALEGDDRYRFLSVNPAFARATGRAERDVLGRELGEVIPEPSCSTFRAKAREAIDKRGEVSWESFGKYSTGIRHGVNTLCPMFDAAGQCTLVVTTHDITALLEGQAERRALEAQLQRNQRLQSLGTLASGVAHDFNNVLAAIGANADLARRPETPANEVRDAISEIHKATQRAVRLVRQILAFGRDQPARKEKLDVRHVVDEALGLLRASLPSRIRITTRFAGTPLVTQIDPTQLHQIVMNLVTNASHAIAASGTIEIAAQPYRHRGETGLELAEGNYVRISVIDSGHGMDVATLERVFDPFFTTKPAGEGTGLGLSIVHGIVRGHGGAISVRSTIGEGTAFDLYFPIIEQEPAAVASNGAHILLVDDEEAILFLGQRILTRLGYRVSVHSDAPAALEALRAEPARFDAIITDISLPGMSGVTLLAEARRVRPDIPGLLTSGYVRTEDVETARKADLGEPVLKPHTVEEFSWLVSRLLTERFGDRLVASS